MRVMIFNVSGLIQEGIGATRTYEIEGEVPVEDGLPEKVAGSAELLRTKDGVLVRARLRLLEPENCSRCLKPLVEAVTIEFEEEFQATTDVKSGRPLDQEIDPDAFRIDENHVLDLTEAVRQYREVSMEMQPLCRPDCRGLCPRCGADLNEGDHDCEAGPVDSRWAGLAALRLEGPEGKD